MLKLIDKLKMHLKANRDQVLREAVDTFQNIKEGLNKINISKK